MLLNNLLDIQSGKLINVGIAGQHITSVCNSFQSYSRMEINFEDAIVFPGLINSHDHLDFNCFSPLGDKTYSSYVHWGKHIHTDYKKEIDAITKVPQKLRTEWGMYKNLIAGVTTVVNHGTQLPITHPLINIHQQAQNLHSVQFEKNWKIKLNNPFLKRKSCAIHVGEGSDQRSFTEVEELVRWNLLKRDLIGIHGVAINGKQAKQFKGLVWCPVSNDVLLKKHADIKTLKRFTSVVFGTDSTLTGDWNIWHHLRFARNKKQITDEELFAAITSLPAALWKQPSGEIAAGKKADIVVAKKKRENSKWDDFFSTEPRDLLLVMHGGNIRLFDESLCARLACCMSSLRHFTPVQIGDSVKYIQGDLPQLAELIKRYNPNIRFPFQSLAEKESYV